MSHMSISEICFIKANECNPSENKWTFGKNSTMKKMREIRDSIDSESVFGQSEEAVLAGQDHHKMAESISKKMQVREQRDHRGEEEWTEDSTSLNFTLSQLRPGI